MKMYNSEIYMYANNIIDNFGDTTQKLPIKVNFYLQKNKEILVKLAQEIEQARIDIIKSHSTISNNNEYHIKNSEELEKAQEELDELLQLEQEVQIYKVNIDSFPDDIILTTGQMEALMFMIN